jgi:hypothetical protein
MRRCDVLTPKILGIVRSGARNECKEQYPYTGHFLRHGCPGPHACPVFTLPSAYDRCLVDIGPLTPNHRAASRRGGSGRIRNSLARQASIALNSFTTRKVLATILWLVALRREGQVVGTWAFLPLGIVVMPPALLLALGSVVLLG